ncbi:leucine-rich repeat and IQ domain-containing protein 1 [Scomber scombrus]|uniref:leucine-rich repeat and IQ domain-containing protein 1 n=1 Tax=Scomber scombrus TaxID=13677 RepID=UPI002DDC36A4|nr:leucine-rich repeat and IQ domain-containing protein 1 [Scomber scombrus]
MQELNGLVLSDTEEEQDGFSFHQEEAPDEIPQSLLSYFKTSKSRAAACEKLILEELEDLTASHHAEDMRRDLPTELNEDTMTLNEPVMCGAENEENNTFTDTRLLPAPTETEALFTHNVSVCHNKEDEAGTDKYTECEQQLALDTRTLEMSLNEEERKKNNEYEVEREKERCEEMKKEQQRRQREEDFQEELKKIIEAEKLHQKELELMGKRAEEKLEQELLLRQELISNLQRQVAEERRIKEEEQKRMKKEREKKKEEEEERSKREEENRRKWEEVKSEAEAERKRMEEETRRMKEEAEKRKIEEIRLKEEEERRKKQEEERKKREEEEKRRIEKEENKKKEEERYKIELEKKKMEYEMRRMMEEEERNKRIKDEEEERKRVEVVRKKFEEEKNRKMEEEIRLKTEEEWRKRKEKNVRKDEEVKIIKEVEERKKQEETRKEEDDGKKIEAERKMYEEIMKKSEKEHGDREEDYRKTQGEMRLKEEKDGNKGYEEDNEEKEGIKKMEEDSTIQTSSSPDSESTVGPTITETLQQHDLNQNMSQSPINKTTGQEDPVISSSTSSSGSLLLCLPEHTEHKRLSWMKDCVPWSKLSLHNRRKQRGSVRSRRGPRRDAEASCLPSLSPDTLLQSTGWKTLQEVTTMTLEDLPGCSLSTLAQCRQLRSLTLRRCGLKALEGINQLPELCYIDVQENNISFVDCENMTSLQVLRLGHNRLTSIHGLSGADNLAVLDLSHNSITRIAGLESMRRLQRLSVDHNQLISTKGLRDIYTLLHLDCAHNHLVSVEGLENSALLNTLDLTANSLAEAPSLNNQVLLRELHLDDNSISSLQGLTACWLPLMQILSVAQNRITQLPSMSDFVSLANLDLRLNCLSELKNVCESLEGCQFLQEVHLVGNPLEQESGWRSTMEKAVPGLRAIDSQETDPFLSPPAVQQVRPASGSFLALCQAQLQQTCDLLQQHNEELSNASLPLDSVETLCRHFTEALQLAEDQRFAHEYGDTTAADKQRGAAGQTTAEETLDEDSSSAGKFNECPDMEFTGKMSPLILREDNISSSYWTLENLSTESWHDTLDTVTVGPKMKSADSKVNCGSFHSFATKGKMTSANLKKAAVSNHRDPDLKNTAAVVIQQQWRKYRQKCGNIISPPTAEKKGGGKGGGGGKPKSGPSCNKWNVVGRDHAATVIQAFWRGFTLRRRLTSALAAVTCPSTREDDTFEEVDIDEFVYDEAGLEKDWTLPISEDSPPRCYSVSEQPLSQKPPGPLPELSQYILPPPPVWRPKQAWLAGEKGDSAGQRVSPESSDRSKSPASTSMLSGLSKRSEKILEEWGFTDSHTALQMLKRAQKMKSKKQQQKKLVDPAIQLALFRKCTYQLDPVEARHRPAPRNRNFIKGSRPHIQRPRRSQSSSSQRDAATTVFANSHRFSDPTERDPVKCVTLTSSVLEETTPAAFLQGDYEAVAMAATAMMCRELALGAVILGLRTPSSGSIPSARGVASPARPSQRSPAGANVSGFESSPFWSEVGGEEAPKCQHHVSPLALVCCGPKPPPSPPTPQLSDIKPPPDVLEEYWRGIQEVLGQLWMYYNNTPESSKQIHHLNPNINTGSFDHRSPSVLGTLAHFREAELGLPQEERNEQVRQERAQEWLHTQAAQSDRDSESEHFLPEISSDILNGGRVQLVVKKEIPSPKRVTSAPSKKDRISFRDNPVQLSGGWGGGKKRDKVCK